jgi:Zn-dependent protease with chaperone function
MILALFALAAALLALPGVLPMPPRRLPVGEWSIVALLAIIVGAFGAIAALALAAVPALANVLGIASLADHCRTVLAPLTVEPTFVSWVAGALAVTLGVRTGCSIIQGLRRARSARIEPWLGEHRQRGSIEVVIVPTETLLAFGVPGRSPQVVLSSGLIDALDADQVEAVVAHEVAHLRLRHPLVIAILHGIDAGLGFLPFVALSVRRARAALELWADQQVEHSSTRCREALRTTLAGFADIACTSSGVAAETRERVVVLEGRGEPRPAVMRAAAYTPVGVLVLTVVLTAAGWFTDAHHAVALGDPCVH